MTTKSSANLSAKHAFIPRKSWIFKNSKDSVIYLYEENKIYIWINGVAFVGDVHLQWKQVWYNKETKSHLDIKIIERIKQNIGKLDDDNNDNLFEYSLECGKQSFQWHKWIILKLFD